MKLAMAPVFQKLQPDMDKPKIAHVRFIPLAIVSFSLMPIFKLCSIRYVYDRYAKEYGLNTDAENSSNFSKDPLTENRTHSELEDMVQKSAATFNMYFVIVHSICIGIAMPLWGALSDIIGRKIPVAMSTFGAMIHITAVLAVFYYDLPLWVILVGLAVHCVFGNQPFIISCAGRTFICDNVESERKIFEITLHALWITIGSTLGSLASGFLIFNLGYLYSTLIVLVLQPALIIYTLIFIPKFGMKGTDGNNNKKDWDKLLCAEGLSDIATKSLRVMFLAKEHRKEIIVLILIHIICTAGFSCDTFLLVYVQGAPMYWRSRTIGLFLAGSGMVVGLASPIATYIWKKNSTWSKHWLMLIGIFSGILKYVIYGLSHHTYIQFIGVAMGMLYYIPYQASLAIVSDLVPKESQGALVSGATTAQLLVSLATTILYNYVYSATIAVWPGTVFFIGAFLYCLCIPLIIYAKRLYHERKRERVRRISLGIDEEEDSEEETQRNVSLMRNHDANLARQLSNPG